MQGLQSYAVEHEDGIPVSFDLDEPEFQLIVDPPDKTERKKKVQRARKQANGGSDLDFFTALGNLIADPAGPTQQRPFVLGWKGLTPEWLRRLAPQKFPVEAVKRMRADMEAEGVSELPWDPKQYEWLLVVSPLVLVPRIGQLYNDADEFRKAEDAARPTSSAPASAGSKSDSSTTT